MNHQKQFVFFVLLLSFLSMNLIHALESRELKKGKGKGKLKKSKALKDSKSSKAGKKSKKGKKDKKDKKSKKGKKGKKGMTYTESPEVIYDDDIELSSFTDDFKPSNFDGGEDDDEFGTSSAEDDNFNIYAGDDDEVGFCDDNRLFFFSTNTEGKKDCEWLAEKEERQEKWCDTYIGRTGTKVKYECRKTCSNLFDVLGCNPKTGSTCKDKPGYMFMTSSAGTVNCAWLAKKTERQARWCTTFGSDLKSDSKVMYNCQVACKEFHNLSCKEYDNRIYPVKCRDSPSFSFKTDNAGTQNCDWLAAKDTRQDKWCNTKGSNDEADYKVKYYCRNSCKRYNSICPERTAPTINCKDRRYFRFQTTNAGEVNCEWLKVNEVRKNKWCTSKGSDGKSEYKVKFYCQDACSKYIEKCDLPPITCKDDEDFKFFATSGVKRNCSWLSEREFRAEKWCDSRGFYNRLEYKVKYYCQDTCSGGLDDCNKSCKDTFGFKFMTDNAGDQNCNWLAVKDSRQEKWCDSWGAENKSTDKKVKFSCGEACKDYRKDC